MTNDETKEELRRVQAQLENAIDASREGSWMARALDAERALEDLKAKYERLLRHFDESWQECHDGSDSACCKAHE